MKTKYEVLALVIVKVSECEANSFEEAEHYAAEYLGTLVDYFHIVDELTSIGMERKAEG